MRPDSSPMVRESAAGERLHETLRKLCEKERLGPGETEAVIGLAMRDAERLGGGAQLRRHGLASAPQ